MTTTETEQHKSVKLMILNVSKVGSITKRLLERLQVEFVAGLFLSSFLLSVFIVANKKVIARHENLQRLIHFFNKKIILI